MTAQDPAAREAAAKAERDKIAKVAALAPTRQSSLQRRRWLPRKLRFKHNLPSFWRFGRWT